MGYFLILAGILGLDLGTKQWAIKKLPLGERIEILKNNFYFQHIKNTGFAYHKYAGKRKFIVWITGIIITIYSIVFIDCITGVEEKQKAYRLPLAVILGGALGNFFERWKKGHVTDFLLVSKGKNPPIFNFADMALALGFLLLGIKELIIKKEI